MARKILKVGGFFAGIGGLELGLKKAGHKTVFLCEKDPAALKVLRDKFSIPKCKIREDLREIEKLPSGIDLIAGGFPCQDLSQAGQMKGIRGKESGLIFKLFDLIKKAPSRKRPSWILLENVSNMLFLGKGKAMRAVVVGLEKLGYQWAYRLIDSRAFGVCQRRRRVYILAALESRVKTGMLPAPEQLLLVDEEPTPTRKEEEGRKANTIGFYWTEGNRGIGWAVGAVPPLKGGSGFGIPSPPAVWMRNGKKGEKIVLPSIEVAEQLQGLEADWTKVAGESSRERWRLVGNAVTVDVAKWIGRKLKMGVEKGESRKLKDTQGLPRESSWPKAGFGKKGRGNRYAVEISSWPVSKDGLTGKLESLLKKYGSTPLSEKATSGFYERLKKSTLRKREDTEFMAALVAHIGFMGKKKK